MRLVLAATILVALTGLTYAQTPTQSGGRPALGFPLESQTKAPDPQYQEHENAYKSAIGKIPAKQKSDDPWQGVRSSSTPQSQKGTR